jgi:hypothetical protein
MPSFKEAYRDAEYSIRLKAPMLRIILIVFLAFMTLTAPRSIARRECIPILNMTIGMIFTPGKKHLYIQSSRSLSVLLKTTNHEDFP